MMPLRPLLLLPLLLATAFASDLPIDDRRGAVDDSLRALTQPSWTARAQAISELSAANDPQLLKRCESWLVGDDPRLRAAAIAIAAAQLGDSTLREFPRLANDKDPLVRLALARAVGSLLYRDDHDKDSRAATAILVTLAADKDLRVRIAALQELGKRSGSNDAARALLDACRNAPEEVAFQAVESLKAIEAPKLLATLAPGLLDGKAQNRVLAANALAQLGSTEAVTPLLNALSASDGAAMWEARAAICDALGVISPLAAEPMARIEKALLPLLTAERWGIRASAAWALGRIGSAAVVPALIAGLGKKDNEPFLGFLRQLTGAALTARDEWERWLRAAAKPLTTTRLPLTDARSTLSFYDVTDTTQNVLFVIDVSGSMAETSLISQAHQRDKIVNSKLHAAKDQLWSAVLGLEHDTRFNLELFSTGVTVWNEGPLRASWRVKAKLKEHLDGLSPGGATNACDALTTALDQWGGETLYFLTDGLPTVGITDIAEILKRVGERNLGREQPIRIHTIAFFVPEGQAFLTALAAGNGGQYKLVQ